MRHFWITDENADNIMPDHRGQLRGAVAKAKTYLKKHPETESIYINEGEDIVMSVQRWEVEA